ncbi:hypothetical protein AMEX_G7542 [Astyanax mexicanus]|uniref:Uncharacterized protein n=1 Tax=Astyanax mexicanus TaxID=7994 RepID=A0A8T2M6F7_ASTMX|nr:hypothetical protein AMEX_G7542 [Astyanax mexicanus]
MYLLWGEYPASNELKQQSVQVPPRTSEGGSLKNAQILEESEHFIHDKQLQSNCSASRLHGAPRQSPGSWCVPGKVARK